MSTFSPVRSFFLQTLRTGVIWNEIIHETMFIWNSISLCSHACTHIHQHTHTHTHTHTHAHTHACMYIYTCTHSTHPHPPTPSGEWTEWSMWTFAMPLVLFGWLRPDRSYSPFSGDGKNTWTRVPPWRDLSQLKVISFLSLFVEELSVSVFCLKMGLAWKWKHSCLCCPIEKGFFVCLCFKLFMCIDVFQNTYAKL